MLKEEQKNLLAMVVGAGREANNLIESLNSLGSTNSKMIKDGKEAIEYLKDHTPSIIYVAGEMLSMNWLTFIQIVRSEPQISFCQIVFIRSDIQSFAPGELEKVGKNLFTEVRVALESNEEIMKEFDELSINNSDPNSVLNMLNQAKAFYKTGLVQKASEIYSGLSEEITGDISVQIGATECNKYDLDTYNQQLTELLDKDPENYNIKFQMLKNLASSEDLKDFRSAFNDIVSDLSSADEQYWIQQLGEICLNIRIPVFSERIAEIMEKNLPEADKWQAYIYKARQFLAAGDVVRAESFATKAQKSCKEEKSEIFNVLGIVEKRKGRLRKALEHFENAKKLSPWDYRVAYNIALCYKSLDKNDKAVEYLEEILSQNPNYDKATQMLSNLKRKSA